MLLLKELIGINYSDYIGAQYGGRSWKKLNQRQCKDFVSVTSIIPVAGNSVIGLK